MLFYNCAAQKWWPSKEEFHWTKYLTDNLLIMAKVKIKQVKSSIKRIQNQKRTLEALGLRGIGKEVTHEATPNILGMIKKVQHLVSVTEA